MVKMKINLNGNINDAKKFNSLINNFESDLSLRHGRYVIDAKSIMGIYCLNFDQDLDLEIIEKVDGEADKIRNLMLENNYLVQEV